MVANLAWLFPRAAYKLQVTKNCQIYIYCQQDSIDGVNWIFNDVNVLITFLKSS